MTDDKQICPICNCEFKATRSLGRCYSLSVNSFSRVCIDSHGVHGVMYFHHTAKID